MYIEKQKVLADAKDVLNKSDQPWSVIVEGDTIIAQWKWMDATFFSPNEVNDVVREYSFSVTLNDNGKWREVDTTQKKSSNISVNGGSIKFGASTQSFAGKTTQKSFAIGLGKNKETGEVGVIEFKFDTSLVKNSIRTYLTECGWKKAGLFG